MSEESTEFTTHATNFTDAISTGVDPKTGQLTLQFPLLHLSANCLSGPEVNIALNYSTITMQDGFGIAPGVSLTGITVLNTEKSSITLSTGDSWPISGNKIKLRKLKDCILTYSDSVYHVHWKSGVTEVLKKVGPTVYVTNKIISATGKQVLVDSTWNGRVFTVNEISDSDRIICKFSYKNAQIFVDVWPDTDSNYNITLKTTNKLLSSITRTVNNNKSDNQTWEINHSIVSNSEYKPTKITHPLGLIEEISYGTGADGLQFPVESGQRSIPRVSEYKQFYGHNQPMMVKKYSYSANNFLGYGAHVNQFGTDVWESTGDYIYRRLTGPNNAYTYSSTERITDNGVTQSIERTYNNYHQLIKEVKEQNSCKVTKEIKYFSKYGIDIDSQPSEYLTPSEHIVTYSKNGTPREEKTSTRYDEFGNPLQVIYADGRIEKMEWYPVSGEEGFCPADPKGLFSSFLKKQELIPSPTDYEVEKTVILHTYEDIGNGSIMRIRTSTYNSIVSHEKLIHETEYSYNKSDKEQGFYFGRLSTIKETTYSHNAPKIISFEDIKEIFYILHRKSGELVHQITRITHDNITVKLEKTYSLYTGKLVKEVDYNGVISTYEYDKANRVTKITASVDSKYAWSKSWRYEKETLSNIGSDVKGAKVTNTDSLSAVIYYYNDRDGSFRSILDGAGRVIRYEQLDIDLSGNWFPIMTREYNSRGNIASETHQDWTIDDRKNNKSSISYTIDYEYDDWGRIYKKTDSTGCVSVSEHDPIALSVMEYCYKKTEDTEKASQPFTSGYKKTHFNLFNKPIIIECFDKKQKSISIVKYDWDGAGLLRKYTNELNEDILYEYDTYGREVTRKFPDNAMVCRSYAPFSTQNLICEIGVKAEDTYHIIGWREFDGLSRMTRKIVGGRETQYKYTPENVNKPTAVISPSGQTLCYEYVKELNDKILTININNPDRARGFIQFDYTTEGNLETSIRDEVSHTQNEYYKSGRLQHETSVVQNETFSSGYAYTLRGELETFSDIYNQSTQYNYDEYGRLQYISNRKMKSKLTYDDFGRISSRQSSSDDINMTMTVSYDDFHREIQRTFTDDLSNNIDVIYSRLSNGMISEKTTTSRNGSAQESVSERYEYDKCLRLTKYTGDNLPNISDGRKLESRVYNYDFFNNITKIESKFPDNSPPLVETYIYNNKEDPTQLSAIQYGNGDEAQPYATTFLSYDKEGRVIVNAAGNSIGYNQTGGIDTISDHDNKAICTYKYDAGERLKIKTSANDTCLYFYCGNEVVSIHSDRTRQSILKLEHTSLATTINNITSLLGGDHNESIFLTRNEEDANEVEEYINLPYGENIPVGLNTIGFNCEFIDTALESYHLGNGYRSYRPSIRRFEQPDDDSPFGVGGINCYAYCEGDPVNRTDPSGHVSTLEWATTGLMFATFVADVVSLGMAIPATAAMTASAWAAIAADSLAIVSSVAGITSNHMLDPNVNRDGLVGVGLAAMGSLLTVVGIGFTIKCRKALNSYKELTTETRLEVESATSQSDRIPLLHEDEVDSARKIKTLKNQETQTSLRKANKRVRTNLSTQTSLERTFSDVPESTSSAGGLEMKIQSWKPEVRKHSIAPVSDGRHVVLTNQFNSAAQQEDLGIGVGRNPLHKAIGPQYRFIDHLKR